MQYAWLKTLQSEKQQLIAVTKKYTLTTNHTKSTKKSKTRKCYPQMTQMDADERHEDLTGMDIDRIRNWVGSAVSADRLYAFRLWRLIPRLRDRWITSGEPPVASKRNHIGVFAYRFRISLTERGKSLFQKVESQYF
jgi:hypothetical protein